MTPLRFAATSSTIFAATALGLAALLPQGCVAPSTTAPASAAPNAPAPAPAKAEANTTADPEAKEIAILQSAANAREKDAACSQLKHVGTTRCIPAVAALLTDQKLSHSARLVLEPMTAPEAGAAILAAVPKASGAVKAGLIDSLGVRRETRAVPVVSAALHDSDPAVVVAAVSALGAIASPDAVAAVEAFLKSSAPGAVHQAAVAALLQCADRLRAAGELSQAGRLFEILHTAQESDAIRVAAFRGVLLCAGPRAAELACAAIVGPAGSDQLTALQVVHDLAVPGATGAFAALLPRLDAPRQVAVINGLSQRNDPSAAPAIAALARSPSLEVRMAALTALGNIGEGAHAILLAETAATTTGPEQTAARDALVMLKRGQPVDALLAQLPTAKPPVQAEIARALAARTERSAVPKLQTLAAENSDSGHAAVLALARLGEQESSALAALVQLVVGAKDEPARSFAAVALNSAFQHIQYNHGRADVRPLVQALQTGPVEARVDLLPCCARINDPAIRQALRAALADPVPAVRDAATAALCATKDAELLPDLVNLASSSRNAEVRSSAVAACVRLSKDDTVKLTDAQRLDAYRKILAASPGTDDKRRVAAGLAAIPELDALQLLTPLLDDPAVSDEAAQAVLVIAPLISDRAAASAALQKIASATRDEALRRRATQSLSQTGSGFGFITNWRVTGPFQQAGRDYADLFEYVFKPESKDPQGVKWEPLARPGPAAKPWLVDVRRAMGKQEAVAYAETWVHADAARPVQLEVGSDSSMKIWVNQKLVHTNPALRPLHAGADTISASLKPGWNSILVKLAQPGQSGEFCVRLLDPDGSLIPGLQINPAGPMKN